MLLKRWEMKEKKKETEKDILKCWIQPVSFLTILLLMIDYGYGMID